MLRVRNTITIAADPQTVWAFFADVPRAPTWVPIMEYVAHAPPNGLYEGAEYTEVSRVSFQRFTTTWVVEEWTPYRRQAYSSVSRAMQSTLSIEFTEEPGSTLVQQTFRAAMMPAAPLVGRMLEYVFGGRVERGLRTSLRNAKALIEEEVRVQSGRIS